MGIRVFIVVYVRNVKCHFFCITGQSGDFESRGNYLARLYFLSCNAPAVVTLQLLACFTCVAFWRVANRKSLGRSSCEKPPNAHILEFLHTLSHVTLT